MPTTKIDLPWRVAKAIDRFSDATLEWERAHVAGYPAYELALHELRQAIIQSLEEAYARGAAQGFIDAEQEQHNAS